MKVENTKKTKLSTIVKNGGNTYVATALRPIIHAQVCDKIMTV